MKLGTAVSLLAIGALGIGALAIGACGGSGGAQGSGPGVTDPGAVRLAGGGTSGTPVSDAERQVGFESIAAKVIAVEGLDDAAQNEALARHMAASPLFEEAGFGLDGAWGRFTDGRILILDNEDVSGSRPVDPEDLAAWEAAQGALSRDDTGSAGASGTAGASGGSGGARGQAAGARKSPVKYGRTGLPWSNRICLYQSVDTAVWQRNVRDYVESIGPDGNRRFAYDIEGGADNATVENLKAIPADCAVIGFAAHGGTGAWNRRGDRVYAMYTSTPIGLTAEVAYADLLQAGDLVYYHPLKSNAPGTSLTELILQYFHYAVTASFAEKFWAKGGGSGGPRFSKLPFVYFNTCRGMNAVAKPLRDQVFAAGASVVAGWTLRSLGEDGNRTASYVFDRLLGANLYPDSPTPPQRPFGWDQLDGEMRKLRLGSSWDDKYGGISKLEWETGIGDFGLLAPSIRYLMVDDVKDELQVHGDFDMQEIDVLVNDAPCPIVAPRRTGELHCTLPRFGPGSSGDVKLSLRGNDSNHVKLTSWKGKATYRIRGPQDALKHEWTYEIHARGDVHDFRFGPGEEPVARDKVISMMSDSTCEAEFSGEYADAAYKVTWKGDLVLAPFPPTDGRSGTSADKGFQFLGYVGEEAPDEVWLMLWAIGGSANVENEWARKDGKWEHVVTDQPRITSMPMGPDLVGGDGMPFLSGFTYKKPTTMDPNGVIRQLKMGPEGITGFGNLVGTPWTYVQDVEIGDLRPEQGTEPNEEDAR
ncbi:MAG: hypothetical protein FJ087_20145 [Deltaproteobacteria bacterium]|nr:hypothetical protein [Deltaproteobacteria bacterium]